MRLSNLICIETDLMHNVIPLMGFYRLITGPGGRITDYRIPDFCQLMKAQLMAPGSNIIPPEKAGLYEYKVLWHMGCIMSLMSEISAPNLETQFLFSTAVDPQLGGPNLRARSLIERNTRYAYAILYKPLCRHATYFFFFRFNSYE